MSEYTDAVERGLRGLDYVSTGLALGCPECGLESKKCTACKGYGTEDIGTECPHCHGEGSVPCDETDRDEACDEGLFSWHACDCCGSTLGGNRYAAHGLHSDGPLKGKLCHLEVCADCLVYIANGDEPESDGQ